MRARRLRRLLLGGFAALVLSLGWQSPAAARPDDARAPGDHDCSWEVYDLPGGEKRARLSCADGIEPDDVPEDHQPPLPAGCRVETVRPGLGDQGPYDVTRCDASVPLTDNTMEWITCRDEHDFWFDDERSVQIPRNAPQWWKDEIRFESEDDEGRGCQIAEHVPKQLCSEVALETYDSPGLLPDECWGTYPSSNYEVNWDDGGMFDFDNKMQGWTGSFMYNVGKGGIQSALWLVGWAFSFDITEYTSFANHLAGSYQTNIVGPFGLEDIVWYALIAWAGFTALRGRLGMAGGEILVAVVLAGLATVLFTNRGSYMDSVAELMDETSARLLVAAQSERCLPEDRVPPGSDTHGRADCREGEVLVTSDPSRPANLRDEIRPLQQRIHEAFIEQPYAYLNWGRVTTDRCLEAQNRIIGVGFNDDGWPQRHMARAGCEEEARYNRDPVGEKMLGAFLTMLAALVVAFFLGLMALTVVISKFLVAVLFAILPFAALGAILPGGARRMAWSWLGTLLQLIVAVVAMSFLLALLMLGVDEVLRSTADLDLVERWFIVLLIVSCVFFARRRMLAGSKSLAENFANTMTRLTPAGASSTTGNWGGVDLQGVDRGVSRTARTAAIAGAYGSIAAGSAVAGGLAVAGRTVVVRRAEARVARRNLRNLTEIQHSNRGWEGYRMTELGGRGGGGGGPSVGVPGGGRSGPVSRPPAPAAPGGRPAGMPGSFHQTPGGTWHGPVEDWPAAQSALSGGGVPRGGGGSAPPPPPSGSAFMFERGAPPNFDPSNRRELWGYLRDVQHMQPIHDKGITRFVRPFQARAERRMHQRYVRDHQQATAEYLGAYRGLRGVSRRAGLVDRRGRPFGWP
ncbi:MAG: type IV secretion system protein [Acidimicrobiales bacterium]